MTITIYQVPMTRPRYTQGRIQPVRCIVLHATAGSAPGDYEWLRKGGADTSPVSVHYYIAPDGRITQFVNDRDTAWHAGASSWLIDGMLRDGLNTWSVGIELSHNNRADTPHTDAQYEAAVALVQMLVRRYDVPRDQVVRHVDISPGRKTDPAALPWPRFLDDVFLTAPSVSYTGASPIVGEPIGDSDAALRWLSVRAKRDAEEIIETYDHIGTVHGVDWFLALAQSCHETGNWTSALSQPHNRDGVMLNNPAGIGVTGVWSVTPKPGMVWDADRNLYRACVPFWSLEIAVRAHLGRLLAYAVTDAQATPVQRVLIDEALRWRDLPANLRGSAPTIGQLGGKWAPSEIYGIRVAELAERMRRS